MKVVWSATALSQLTAIYDYIAKDSSRYALRMIDRLNSRTKQIGGFPESGQIVPENNAPSIREVIEGPYRVIYQVERHRVTVLAVVHGSQLLPSNQP